MRRFRNVPSILRLEPIGDWRLAQAARTELGGELKVQWGGSVAWSNGDPSTAELRRMYASIRVGLRNASESMKMNFGGCCRM